MVNIAANLARSKWVLPILAAALAVPASLLIFPESSISSAIAQSSDTLKRLVDRSPGVRGATAPLKGKGKGKSAGMGIGENVPPEQRALGKVFDSVPEEAINDLAAAPSAPQAIPGTARPLEDITDAPLPPRSPGFTRPGGLIVPVGGSSSGGSSGTSSGTISSSSGGSTSGGSTSGGTTSGGTSSGGSTSGGVTPPVPEPGTWMMMILGFGLIGGMMRRHRRTLAGQTNNQLLV